MFFDDKEPVTQDDIDFENELAIFLLLGDRGSPNYSIRVKEMYIKNNYLNIQIEHYSTSGCPEIFVESNPYSIVKFKDQILPIIFNEVIVEDQC